MSALDEIKAAKANLDHAKYEYEREQQRIVACYCPIQIGDILYCQYTKNTTQFVVRSRRAVGNYWRVSGPILKKDGTEGERIGDLDQRIEE